MSEKEKNCFVCEKPLDKCECCAECGHVCSLDRGELYCPVCFPEPQKQFSMNERDEHYMGLAIEEAEQAYKKGEVPVGALIVVNNAVVACAHNSTAMSADPTAHAELSVIREAGEKRGDWRLEDGTLYVTKEPCVMCAGAMLNARLGRLVYGCVDERYGAVNSRYQLLHDPFMNHQVKVVSGVLGDECAGILKNFFRARR